MDSQFENISTVKEYYGKILQSNADLQTSACCTAEAMPNYLKPIVKELHDEVVSKFYGCGSPIPPDLTGKTVLDLGSGSGRDCFILSKLVGAQGRVIGVDMTQEQLAVAKRHVDYHTRKFGFDKPNVEFRQGYIEDLKEAGIADASVDLVVSNCVLNLSPNKKKVFAEIFRTLKPGGELYFSDVFASRRVPEHLQRDPVLLGECLGGALYIEDFRRMLFDLGCPDYRVVSKAKLTLNNEEIEAKAGMIDFYSMTIRAFKLDLEDRCEDYGQVAFYQGTIPQFPHGFLLDDHHLFRTGIPVPICGNTAAMIGQTRFAKHFKIIGDTETHYGLFDCGPTPAITAGADAGFGACC